MNTPPPELERISDYVLHYAKHAPHRLALAQDDRRVTYEQLAQSVRACARALLACGIEKGDRVAMLATPSIEFYVVYMATVSIGGIWLGLNPRHRLGEFRDVLADARPKLLISRVQIGDRRYCAELAGLLEAPTSIERLITLGGVTEGRSTPLESFLGEGESISSERYESACARVAGADCALLIYTSGSTGKPKGAMLSHRGIVRARLIEAEHWDLDRPRTVVNLPINHIAGGDEIPDYCLVCGGTSFFMEQFDARGTLALIQREKLNYILQFPTQFQLMVSVPDYDSFDLSSLELVVWAGAPASRDLLARLRRLDARLATAWGQTETSGEVTFTDTDATFEVLSSTMGRIEPRYESRLVTADGRPAPSGEAGELHVRDEILMLGYFARPEATREAIDGDGWLRTGDVFRLREDGNVELIGRLKEMYKSGGYNVYPREVEIAIESHPAVAMAAVVAVPDPLYQEVGHAFVETEPGMNVDPAEIEAHCRTRIANYKVPKRILVSDDLPKFSTGKLDKKALQASAVEALRALPGDASG